MGSRADLRYALPITLLIVWAVLGSHRVATGESPAMRHEPVYHVEGRFFIEIELDLEEISSITDFCLGCHDGTIGPAQHGPMEPKSHKAAGFDGMSGLHPIDTNYPDGDIEFAPRNLLPSRMLMDHGRVTCVTCHDLVDEKHGLVVANRRSRLCLTCHRK